jgi:hypothetical protein
MQHHDDKTIVHITLNTQTVPHRKGVGNMPFVFRAYGTAHLDPPRTPPTASSTPAPGAAVSTPAPSLPPLRIFPTYKRRARSPPPLRCDDALQQHGPEQRRQQCRVALASRGIRILGRRGVLVARARPPEPHASPRSRYRVARVARRLLGLTERGLESEAAEEADAVEGRVQGQSKKGARKDRARLQKERVMTRTRVTRSATEEVWNPFAHLKDV